MSEGIRLGMFLEPRGTEREVELKERALKQEHSHCQPVTRQDET